MTDITLLDGGMGQELVNRSGDTPTPLWGTQVMVDHPGMVEAIHRDYFDAGATIATTNTYALHRDRLDGTPLDGRQAGLVAQALAEAAAVRQGRADTRIAGSIGPLVASYRPETHPPHEIAVPLYADLSRLLGPGVDLIIAESVASVAHAAAVLEGARQAGKPVWLSVTVDDEDGALLRSGEPLTALAGLDPDAWLANCSAPEAMAAALATLKTFGKPFGAYANGFTQITKEFLKDKSTVDALHAREDLTPERYADFVLSWIAQGATIVGGCCETGPAHIRAIADRLRAEGHTIF
jgi:homocysteine S-methyltransferase